ncbi:MAG: hypothetical protein JW717_06055 [Marinilabiliaceae bacterium]|nr:hypothetical protein [Marinilabiliaceae bacterium]
MSLFKLLITFCLLITITFFACGPNNEEIAKERFNKAELFYAAKEFNNAKLILDSIINKQKNVIEYYTRAKDLLRTINIEEQKNNIAFLDSLLKEKERELEPLMKNFVLTNEYKKKKLIHKRQKTINSYNRTYIKTNLELDGTFYISSYFCGEYIINHEQIKVYNSNQSVTSEKVPFDSFNNRHFNDGGLYWEIVNYKDGNDNGIIDFIAQNVNAPLKVMFIGKKNFYVLMEKFDKEAIRDGYEISFILKEVEKLKTEIKNSEDALKRL